ncbi:dynamin GTPase [Amylocarpus encephaloides]|uniref:Dynamin GTPase n=1 Tax=Amylocarpus encephaloides TaxID=45428 RepID=A0A9P8C4E7_9HELO|nr:dynamin GTPase [Amylocarpus encephaloides]
MLDKIDRLFACNVGSYIDLPQLVVVGDQSSGKSSVLEGLTNLPFPRDSGLFETSISMKIIPGKQSNQEHAEHVRGWRKADLIHLNEKTFADIMREVPMAMGLSEKLDGVDPPTFSDDVLSLEVRGPDQEHLSIIDVPGIFKKTTPGVTNKDDIQMVRSMVYGYMENSRSVMLTVIPANVDIATQEILEMAEEVDPNGQRTLGVLTKPDLVDKGAENAIIDLIDGRKHPLTHGWHLVRNPGQQHLTNLETSRQALERNFFMCEQPWNSLDKDKVGIPALQVRLREILAEHIRREFPKNLGLKRDTPADQFKYLIEIATRFQENVVLALTARYGGNDTFDQESGLRFATAVVLRNDTFLEAVEKYGHTYCFKIHSAGFKVDEPATQDDSKPDVSKLDTRAFKSSGDIVEIISENEALLIPSGDIMGWLQRAYNSSRGFEIGTINSALLALTWKEQSQKWNSIALGYISDVITIAHGFVTNLLRHVCPDERVRTRLTSVLMDGLVERYQRAFAQVEFVLQVERSGTPMTLDPYFNDNLEKCRQERMQHSMSTKSFSDGVHGAVVRLDEIMQNHPMSNIEHTVQDLHDVLQSYYMVVKKRFVDNVCLQATDHYLVSGPATPLNLFSPAFVGAMTPEQLDEVAGEDPSQKRKRRQLEKEIEELETGRKILI